MSLRAYLDTFPQIASDVYIDETATIIGDVVLKNQVSVWPGTVIRADVCHIRIGARTNIQDLSVLHVGSKTLEKPDGSPLIIGEDVTVGHKVILHGCRIGDRVLIGMGSIVLDDAQIPSDCMIGAGSLIPPNKKLESGYLYLGSPAKAVRKLTEQELIFLQTSAEHYVQIANNYLLSAK